MSLVLRSQRAFIEENAHPGSSPANPAPSGMSRSVRSCNCCPYGYHIDLDFVRYCEALAHEKPSEEEQRRRDRRRSRKSMEFMLGFESLFGGDWQAESRVQGKLSEASHESEPDSPRPIGGAVGGVGMSQSYSTTPCYRPRSSSVPRFTYGSIPPRSESPFGTASSTCSSLRGGVESDVGAGGGIYHHQQHHHRPAISPPETRAFLHEALDEVCSDFERTLERTSVKRRKTPYGGSLSMDRNNNKLSLSLTNGHGPSKEQQSHRLGNSTWDRYFDVADSCIGGNRSPTGTPRPFLRSNTLPLQQRPSPAEVQYESYVQATVAANAKSPVEQLESRKSSPGLAPPPPPRRHHLLATTPTGTPTSKEDRQQENGSMSSSSLQSPVISETGQATADAQALFQIREQMALSLRRLKDLEEQVKVIPDMELELNSLRSEKQKLQRRNEELMRSQRQTPSPPSPGLKTASPVQFTPQRISPVSLESLGARMRSSSTSASPSPSVVRRDVSTQAVVRPPATRDVSVGHQPTTRNVGVQPSETVYSKEEVEVKVEQALSNAQKQKLRKLISVGTQMYVPQREQRDSGVQTLPERPKLKYNVGVTAKPTTRENFTSCKPDVRHVGSSEDRLDDVLCEKCAVSKRSVASGPETPPEKVKPAPQMPGRSNTFSLGENETVSVVRKAIGCQTPVTLVHSAGSQTTTAVVRSTGAQVNPQQHHSAVQCGTEQVNRQTDTNGLQRLSRSPLKAEQVAEPVTRPQTRHIASNTDKEKEPEPVKVLTSHSACNTEEIRKRDVGCGDIVKPHISIACAANYCDSCKEAIQDLARGFSKSSPTTPRMGGAGRRSTSADSRIPRPKHLTSPSPVRKEFKRQNTYTLATPSPTPSPQVERKTRLSSLQEKPPTVSSFQAADPLGESQSFIRQPQKDLLDLSLLGDDELIVREEKRVSISWSRDASPAPLMTSSGTTKSESPEQEPAMSSSSDSSPPIDVQIAQGARKKSSTPLKSSQSDGSQVTVIEKPATKAQLHQLAQADSEPRKKTELSKDLKDALKAINDSLLKKLGAKPISSQSLKSAKVTIQDHWFFNSSTGKSDPHQVEDYLDYFESLSVPLLEYCVNLSDSNGNTAMHYAVSHGNFDVVSILLDSKVCDVNQMNNAGYTSVMLVSLAKLKQPSHRTVVERLFKMADVNIRAKKHCQTALMLAVSHGNGDMVNMLLDAGADINIQDEDGSTALMGAAEHGRIDVIKTLLSHPDCDSLVNDVDGSTAFKIAWQAGHRDVGLLIYVHEQMLRSKLPNRGEPTRSSLISPQRHKRQPSQ
ncbi:KN motif and ankyrin repeat domain-containing protein 2 isoform X3 [Drosophila rhopaloa]|uniref:KN motif and ankyrin repeat domain-containing protein 2 isoform X3 n=1 Tax=Drosophila rhopaloa TaxID=1041015 RepID=A0A6P4EC18_DRORH|nr:KN motif and ankyrin repeat domain-containing protein 2 isoform X3 [Drosophila rhopaloa]XP_016974104.1 KN motif and ankyrin repeat domain-containing protein 2 isoform X3 [Drosophila rhopaloa]XP_016974105.1 KN motif and ankyrin repeat domain-containing protein 2 isoform X3 [Drosophila rhopaloa]